MPDPKELTRLHENLNYHYPKSYLNAWAAGVRPDWATFLFKVFKVKPKIRNSVTMTAVIYFEGRCPSSAWCWEPYCYGSWLWPINMQHHLCLTVLTSHLHGWAAGGKQKRNHQVPLQWHRCMELDPLLWVSGLQLLCGTLLLLILTLDYTWGKWGYKLNWEKGQKVHHWYYWMQSSYRGSIWRGLF